MAINHTALKFSVALIVSVWGLTCAAYAQDRSELFVTKAPAALLIDHESGTVLLSKQPETKLEPASLAKLMTAELVFDALKHNLIGLDTTYPVSEYAWRTGGAPSRTSTMFAAIKSNISVSDLLQGMIVQAANDGAIILAEGLAGSEPAFVEMMNKRAKELGLTDSRFANSTGLPAPNQSVTLSDLIKLAQHIYTTYPEFYPLYSQSDFTWNKIFQRNRNPLLRLEVGADGLGTGFTEASGYSLVGSTKQRGDRLFLAMSGLSGIKEREEEAKKLLEWGMTAFDKVKVYSADDLIGKAQVYGGENTDVSLRTINDIVLLLPKAARERLKATIVYEGPLQAPVNDGEQLASLHFELDGALVRTVPLYTASSVPAGSLSQRAMGAVVELATGWLRKYL